MLSSVLTIASRRYITLLSISRYDAVRLCSNLLCATPSLSLWRGWIDVSTDVVPYCVGNRAVRTVVHRFTKRAFEIHTNRLVLNLRVFIQAVALVDSRRIRVLRWLWKALRCSTFTALRNC